MPANPGFDGDALGGGKTKTSYDVEQNQSKAFRRTSCERGLLFVTVVFGLGIIALIVALVLTTGKSDTATEMNLPVAEVCTSSGCALAAARVLEKMDTSVNPCDNFYQFACGTWKKKTIIPEDRSVWNMFSELGDEINVIIKYLLEGKAESYEDFDAVKKAKDLYSSCNNLALIEQLDVNVSFPLLEEMGGWPVLGDNPGGKWDEAHFDLVKLLQTLRKYSHAPVIQLYVATDFKESEKFIIYLDQPGLGLPGRDYYLEEAEPYISMRQAYLELASSLAQLFGAEKSVADQDMTRMLKLETDIANISVKAEERRDYQALYNKMTVADLAVNFTEPSPGNTNDVQFDWMDYVRHIMDIDGVEIPINSSENIVVLSVPYYEKVFNVLQKYTKREIANYIVWMIIRGSASHLPQRFRDILDEYSETVYGVTTQSTRWRSCASLTTGVLHMAVGHLFVKETFDESSKVMALKMIKTIREAFNEVLKKVDWMDGPTKDRAIEKASAIREWIGYPDNIMNVTGINEYYKNFTIDANGYFQNVLATLKRSAIAGLRKLRETSDKNEWTTPATTVNALYNSNLNTIMFPAGILQPPFYSSSQPQSMNYGGIGYIIGHEITHGFDDGGRQFDKDGNLVQWWDETSIENFKEKTQCIINQFDKFVVPEVNLTVNGINTQGENIADGGGLSQSFKAYRKWVVARGSEEPRLPGIEYNHNQLFFINFAQVWCNKLRPQAMINQIKTGVHSPNEFRVIGTLQNSLEFAAAFNCQPNDYMNPRKKCKVW